MEFEKGTGYVQIMVVMAEMSQVKVSRAWES